MNGEDVKKYRKALNLTQKDLARLIGVSKRTIINYEQGEIIPETKNAILHKVLAEPLSVIAKNELKEPENEYGKQIESLVSSIVKNKFKNLSEELKKAQDELIKIKLEKISDPINERIDYLALGMKNMQVIQANRNDKNDKQFEELKKIRKIN